jgi:hypothetical protein
LGDSSAESITDTGVTVSIPLTNINDFDNAFAIVTKERVNALTMTLNPFINTYRPKILDFVAKNRLPAIFGVPDIVEAVAADQLRESVLNAPTVREIPLA